jgi:glucose-1-phosphate adenylyltransferase
MNSSQTPEAPRVAIGCTRPSQPLKSPTTETRSAFGRPDPEADAGHAVAALRYRAEAAPGLAQAPGIEQVEVILRGLWHKGVDVELTRNTFAIVLAGGRGSRLMQLTDWRSKPAVPFGGKFRIIDFTLSNCVNSGIRRIGVATQYKAQSLIQHLQRGWSFLDGRFHEFIDLLPAQQQVSEDWYKGTADAVFQNLDMLRRNRPKHARPLRRPCLQDGLRPHAGLPRRRAGRHHRGLHRGAARAEASEFGVMQRERPGASPASSRSRRIPPPMPGKPDRALASMGVYVFNADFLYEQLIRDSDDPRSSHDFGKDVIRIA